MAGNNLIDSAKRHIAALLDIERNTGIRAARKEYRNLQEHLPKEEAHALWRYVVDNKLIRLMRAARSPDYLIVYDEMWGKIIESYYLSNPEIIEGDEPDDTLNGPVDGPASGEQAQALVRVLNKRYPEQQRFKIRFVSADSIRGIMENIRWVVED